MKAKNMQVAILLMLSGLFAQSASADIVRQVTFPNALMGTWAETAEQCAAKDKSNVVIESAKYGDGSGICAVRWIVETPGSRGVNYAVHALCTSAAQSAKTQVVNIIIRPLSDGRATMGRSFEDLKDYQRCP